MKDGEEEVVVVEKVFSFFRVLTFLCLIRALRISLKMNSNVIIFIISTLALFPLLIECYGYDCPTSKRKQEDLIMANFFHKF